jgi:hypothetical protein
VALCAAAACLAVAAAVPVAGAAVPGDSSVVPVTKQPQDRLAVGDSVMLGAKRDLKALGFATVDAVESRQSYDGPHLLRKRGDALPTNVVVHLGTNGTFPLDVCKKIVKVAGPSRRVFFVTIKVPRSWQTGNNKVIHACDAAFKDDRVHVIDWNAAAVGHPSWFWTDHIHLRPEGAHAFAKLIDTSVDQAVLAARRAAVAAASGSGNAGTQGR